MSPLVLPRQVPKLLPLCLVAAASLAVSNLASAQPSPQGSSSASVASSAPLLQPPPRGDAALPPGHPAVAPADPSQELPTGHPQVAPRNHEGAGGRMRMPMQSVAREDNGVPTGAIVVDVRNGDGDPVPGAEITLGIVENSIAKGESRQRKTAISNEQGSAMFPGLDVASTFAYRVSVTRDGATYAAPPFNLPSNGSGSRATVFVYPASTDVEQASVAAQGIIYVELRDELLQLEQAYRIFNLGGSTWLPSGLLVRLPEGFKAFNAQRAMNDLVWETATDGAKLRGTISPGMHDTSYRFQLPSPESDELSIDVGVLPHVQSYRVIVDAPKGMTLQVDGFPPAQTSVNSDGQRVLFTERELPRLDPSFTKVKIKLSGVPTRPQGRWIALGLSLVALGGAAYAMTRLRKVDTSETDRAELDAAKSKLLDELASLEKAKASGEIGPKTYERTHRALLDALARIIARSETA